MRRILVAAVSAGFVIAIGTTSALPAAAAPPTAPWSGSAGGDIADVTASAVGLDIAGLRIAVSDAEAGSTLSPRASSTSSNIAASVVGLPIAIESNSQTAPPDAGGPTVGALAAVTTGLVDIGALTTVNEAHWGLDTACVVDGVLSAATTQTAGLDVLPVIAGGVVSLGVSETTGQTSLVQNTGLNYGIQSVATGTITGLSLLGGAVDIAVAGETTLTATATGSSPGTVTYAPATVTVTGPGVSVVLTPAAPSTTINVLGVGSVTVSLNAPTVTTTATSASATSSLLSIDVRLPAAPLPALTEVSLDLLPLHASATAPSGGIDCPAPPPVITTPADGATTGASPTIAGTAEPNATVEVFVDGVSVGTTTADGAGAWTLTPGAALAEGPHTATAVQSVAGVSSGPSAPVAFTVDTTSPPAPVITSPTDGELLNNAQPPISGTAEPNSTVTVIIDGVPVGTTTTDGTGNWTFTPPAPLTDGDHSVTATATDAAGNTSPESAPVSFAIDTTAPAAPVITSPADGSTTNDPQPPITGTAEPGSIVTVMIDGVSAGTTTADGTGNWTFTPPAPLAEGDHTVTATATDAAGNVSPESAPVTFTIDTAAPVAPVITSPADGSTTSDAQPPITGTSEPNAIVTVIIDGAPAGTTTADGTGNWTFTPPAPLSDGDHTVTATATDAGGNVSPESAPVTFTIDTAAPAAPVITSPADGSTTSNTQPPLTGTAEPNATVTVTIDGVEAGTTTADGTGNWTFTPPAPLPDGDHTVTATATDAGGNVSPESAPVAFTIDTAAPAAPAITSPTDGSTTNNAQPPISGTAEPNATVTVTIDGVEAGTTTADATGNWTFTPPTPLTDGDHTVTASATDAAGNVSPESAPATFAVDTTAPPAPVIASPADGSTTDNPQPPITGTAEPDSIVTVLIDGVGAGTATADGTGTWALTPPAPLTDGDHTVTASATDAAGNTSPLSTPVTFTIDTTAPAAPVITSPTNGSSTNDTQPPIAGTAEPNSTVAVTIDGAEVGTTTADGTGNWTFTPPAPLPEGDHTITATATDAAGNTSPESPPVTFTIDTTAPAAPIITSPTDGATTTNAQPPISGTAEPNSTVTVVIDGVDAGTATADGTGTWTFTPPAPLPDGDHTVTATATDAAGNQSPPASSITFSIDATAPAVPAITSPADGAVTTDAQPEITGTAEPGTTVVVTIDGVEAGTSTADGTGSWTFTPPEPLGDGDHTVTAATQDALGNVSPPSTPITFTIDATPPGVPVIITPLEGAITGPLPQITGTAEPGSTLAIMINGQSAGITSAGIDGAWAFVPETALPVGAHTVTAIATDVAGNVGQESDAVTFRVAAAAPVPPGGGGGLPATGAEAPFWGVLIGAVLIGVGALARAAHRSRAGRRVV